MSIAFEYPLEPNAVRLVSFCEYGGDVVAEITASEGLAPVFVETLELLFGETHYAVLGDVDGSTDPQRGTGDRMPPFDLGR